LQARLELAGLQANTGASRHVVAAGQTVTITGHGFIPGRTPNGTTVLDGFGVYLPLPGQFGVTGPPFADPTSTVPGQTWDDVSVTVYRVGHGTSQPSVDVSGPDGNGTVTADIDTTGLTPGLYTATITGDLLTQTTAFVVAG
jgi:hypothetical protein